MNWLRLALLVQLSGCTSSVDDRPRTTEYVTKAVLAPTCGAAQCHSTFARQHGYAFDTVEMVRQTLREQVETGNGQLFSDTTAPADQPLNIVLHRRNGDENEGIPGLEPMPYDAPMPEPDIQLVLEWFALGMPGACTIPDGQTVCGISNQDLVSCGADGAYVYQTAPAGACL